MSFSANPYSGKTFFAFFLVLGRRIWEGMMGKLHVSEMASDEIQILVLISIALSSAFIGTFLVLRRMTMLANSLSHTILLGIIAAFLLGHTHLGLRIIDAKTACIASLTAGLLTTVLTRVLQRGFALREDASIGLAFTALFALGIFLVTLFTKNLHLGVEAIMGNVDALRLDDLKLAFSLFATNGFFLLLFFKPLVISTFDPDLGKNFGISLMFFDYLLMVQTAATAIGAFRAVGVFLFLSFLVAPVLTGRFFTRHLKGLIFLSGTIGIFASLIAVALSRHLLSAYRISLSTGGLTAVALGVGVLLGIAKRSVEYGKMSGRKKRWRIERDELT